MYNGFHAASCSPHSDFNSRSMEECQASSAVIRQNTLFDILAKMITKNPDVYYTKMLKFWVLICCHC